MRLNFQTLVEAGAQSIILKIKNKIKLEMLKLILPNPIQAKQHCCCHMVPRQKIPFFGPTFCLFPPFAAPRSLLALATLTCCQRRVILCLKPHRTFAIQVSTMLITCSTSLENKMTIFKLDG